MMFFEMVYWIAVVSFSILGIGSLVAVAFLLRQPKPFFGVEDVEPPVYELPGWDMPGRRVRNKLRKIDRTREKRATT